MVSQLLRRRRVGLGDLPPVVLARIVRLAVVSVSEPRERQRARGEAQLVCRAWYESRVGDDEFVVASVGQLDRLVRSARRINAARVARAEGLRLVGGWWGISPRWRVLLGRLLVRMARLRVVEVDAAEQDVLGTRDEGVVVALMGLAGLTELKLVGKMGHVTVEMINE